MSKREKKPQGKKKGKAAREADAFSLIRETAQSYYEAAKPSRHRKLQHDFSSANSLVEMGAVPLRAQARFLERNHDLSRGIIRTMVNSFVGPNGIGVEPQPRRADGSIHEEYAKALRDAHKDWQRRPEVTWTHTWAKCQRMMGRVWIRDGEAFAQQLLGNVPKLDHGTRVPYSLELFEPDMIPMHFTDISLGIRQGIQVNTWGRKVAYWAYKTNPLDAPSLISSSELKSIPAERMLHLMRPDRLHQLRGVSEFSAIIARLQDLKEYENAEQIAAKLAAMLTLYVKRGSPELYDDNSDTRDRDAEGKRIPREIEFEPGTIIDSLGIGEEIGLIDSKRPNPNAITWRLGQLRAVAAGVGASYSSIARDYDGSYSAQRQELVEQWVNYAVMTDDFTGMFVRPAWESFVIAADLSGVVRIPPDVVPETADDALFVGQSMPWIDPVKEATAWLVLVKAGFASEVEVMRRRGVNPNDVLEQVASWRSKCAAKGLSFNSDAAMEQIIAETLKQPEAPTKSGSSPKNRTRERATSR